MLVRSHYSDGLVERQGLSLVEDAWARKSCRVCLPTSPSRRARSKPFSGCEAWRPHTTCLRGVLAYVLGPLSTRRLGAWAVLVGVADISEAAWRKRLRASNPWLLWILSELVATSEVSAPPCARPRGRILLVDASCLRQPGGTGDDWRLHLAYDFMAGRLGQVQVTDRRGGEHLGRYQWQAGDVIVADRGYGYRRSVALAVRQQADVVRADPPSDLPLGNGGGPAVHVLRWLRQRGETERDWHGWCRWQGQRYRSGWLPPNSIRPRPSRRGAASAAKRKKPGAPSRPPRWPWRVGCC